ncbi:MAG: Lrp/AsnC family transcriptional regulator [Nanoarchaeota archaeon]
MRVLPIDEIGINKVIFHKYDEKILSLLCKNARIPLSKIAKMVRLSRQSVEYRIRVMEKEHLLAGSRAVINIRKLGYQSYHYFLTLNEEKSEKEFISRAIESNNANVLISYSGKWNYELSIMAKNPTDAQRVFLELIKEIIVVDYVPLILLDNIKAEVLPEINSGKNISLKNIRNDPSFSKQFITNEIKYLPDENDLNILFRLSQNSQITLAELGKKTKMGRDSISYRIKKLIRSKYILEFRPVVDYSVLNLSVQTVLLKVNRGIKQDDRFKEYLKRNKKIIWATEVFGSWDYLIYALTESQDEINNFINELRKEFSSYLFSYEMLFAYKEHKYSFMTEAMKEM